MLRDKIVAKLREYSRDINGADAARVVELLARSIGAGGAWDDILGVPNPTREDVEREAKRVFGNRVAVSIDDPHASIHVARIVSAEDYSLAAYVLMAPTLASAYAALRSLPDWDWEGE